MYGAGSREFLPVMQKANFALTIGLVLLLNYFTRKEDFQPVGLESRES
jgi:hypothetical protein